MKLHLIWAVDGPSNNDPWLIDAWDDDSADGNDEGWQAAKAKAVKEHGALNIRVTTALVDYDKVLAAFQPVDVTGAPA